MDERTYWAAVLPDAVAGYDAQVRPPEHGANWKASCPQWGVQCTKHLVPNMLSLSLSD